MKTFLLIVVLSSLTVTALSQTNANAASPLTWKFQAPVDGSYDLESTPGLMASETIEIEGDRFRYSFMGLDVIRIGNHNRNRVYKGKIIQFPDHIWFNLRKMRDPDRVSGLLDNWPVLWTYEAFDHWRKTGEFDPIGILYWREPQIARDPATNRSEMFRQMRAAIKDD